MTAYSDSEVYPNAPLQDVVCEIRFPGEMEVECNRHLFWEEIRNQYPHILVPNAIADEPPALQHYRFLSESKTRRVSVALNSFAFSDTAYRGHDNFCKEFFTIADSFGSTFTKIEELSRIGWRYINVIPVVRDDGTIPIRSFLNVELLIPENVLLTPKAFDFRVETQFAEGVAIVRLASISRKDDSESSQEAMLLDIDFGCEGPDLRIGSYRENVELARKHSRKLFENIITDEYRSYLRGESL